MCVLPSINRNFTCDALLIVACAILGTTSSCHVSPNQILKKPSFEFISFSSRETMNLKHYITCSLSLLHKDAMVATTLLSKMHLFHLILIHSIIMLTTCWIHKSISTISILKPFHLHPNAKIPKWQHIFRNKGFLQVS